MAQNNLREGWIEKNGSGTEQFDVFKGTGQAQRIFIGPWNERFLFLGDMLPLVGTANNNGYILNLDPYRYPDIPDLLASTVDIRGICKPGNVGVDNQISYDYAEITITYTIDSSSAGFGGSGSVSQASYSIETNTELLRLPGSAVKNKDGRPQHDKGDFFFPLHKINIKLHLKNQTSNITDVGSYELGKINGISVEFFEINLLCPPYTLRYDGSNAESISLFRQLTTITVPHGQGDNAFNPTTKTVMEFQVRYNRTHNFVFNPDYWNRKLVRVEPVNIGQANALPINKIYEPLSIYESTNILALLAPNHMA